MAQTQPDAPKNKPEVPTLKIVKTLPLRRAGEESMLLPSKCDEDGNVYVRFYVHPSPLRAPLYKFSPQGEQLTTFSVDSDPAFQPQGAGVRDYEIGKGSKVFLLAVAEDGNYILSYNKNGSLDAKIKLQIRFLPSRFHVFDSGEFLVTGFGRGTEAHPSHAIITAVFAKDGTWLKRVELPEGKPFEEAADRGDAEFIEPGQIQAGNFAVEEGRIARGADGNLSVVHWADPARVHVIASSGEVVKSFDVKPPLEGRKPMAVFVHGDRMALEYPSLQDDRRSFITVVRLDGQEQTTYDTSDVHSSLACYGESERFTFLGKQLQFAQGR
jgi:hypothetical protein